MDVKMSWKGGMKFEGLGPSGFPQNLDADSSVGGEDSAGRPMEFIAMGLAGCTGMDAISILLKKKQDVKDFQVAVRARRAHEHPKVFTEAVIEYIIHGGNVEEAAVVRAIQLSADKYCPAQAMLSKAFPIRLLYKIFDDEGKTILKSGEYITPDPLPLVDGQ